MAYLALRRVNRTAEILHPVACARLQIRSASSKTSIRDTRYILTQRSSPSPFASPRSLSSFRTITYTSPSRQTPTAAKTSPTTATATKPKPTTSSYTPKPAYKSSTSTYSSSYKPKPSTSASNSNSNSTSTSNSTPAPAPAPSTAPTPTPTPTSQAPTTPKIQNISKTGLDDKPSDLELEDKDVKNDHVDWTRSYHGLSSQPFSKEAADILLQPVDPEDVEIKPDGIVYLPEIKYRRILNRAFGPGGWGLVPRSESIVTGKAVTREYALVAHGRLVSVARGEQDYFSPDGIPTATEGCKSNAMMRCCKDLGVASELWDPRWIRKFKANHSRDVFVEHLVNKRRSKIWIRKDDEVQYPWKATSFGK